MGFAKAVKNFSRLRQIVNILFKEGFGEIVERLHFKSHLTFEQQMRSKEFKDKPKRHMAMHLRRVMEEAGGAYVKLGQMLSLRPDLIPQAYCDEFSKLQDQVKPIPYSQIKKVIEKEFGKPIHKIYESFDREPLAAASIAQVHKAKLRDGPVVAVKVQRPTVPKNMKADIEILRYIAEQAERRMPEVKIFKPTKIVDEFESYTKKELDFLAEGRHIDRFHKKYKYSQRIRVPQVFWDHTTSKVLTMTFLDGKKVSAMKALSQTEKKKVALTVYHSFITQVFDMHVFHADPHPGNIFVLKDGKIALLDFGIVGRLSPDLSDKIDRMLIGLVKGDLDTLAYSFIDLGAVEDIDIEKFKEAMFDAWGEYHGRSMKKINMKRFFADTFDLARKYKIEYPSNFVLLTKAIVTVQALGERLYPESNFVEIVTPEVKKLMKERHSPKHAVKSVRKSASEIAWTVRRFPQDLRSFMHLIKTGPRIRVDIEAKDLKYFTREMDRSSNRITYGLILGGLIVGAGLIIASGFGPYWGALPALAWVMIIIMLLLGFALVLSIMRENKGGLE